MAVNAARSGDFDLFLADWAGTRFSIGVSHHIILRKVNRDHLDALAYRECSSVVARSSYAANVMIGSCKSAHYTRNLRLKAQVTVFYRSVLGNYHIGWIRPPMEEKLGADNSGAGLYRTTSDDGSVAGRISNALH